MCHHSPSPSKQTVPPRGERDIDSNFASTITGVFSDIRRVCESGGNTDEIDLRPSAFKSHRITSWPDANMEGMGEKLSIIYDTVKRTGLPNCMQAKCELPTNLNIPAWERELAGEGRDPELLQFIKFGFPLGYAGPVSDCQNQPNHKSATEFPDKIGSFIDKEVRLGGIVGPMASPPFVQWSHISPLMSREKKGSEDRRVIVDMTFPSEVSVNSYIYKNTALGSTRDHTLPSVDDVVEHLHAMGPGSYMATTDLSRAYKNFYSCPLDWPLLGFSWNSSYYCDITMPFGARSSICSV